MSAVRVTVARDGEYEVEETAQAADAAVGVETVLLASDVGAVVSAINWNEAVISPSAELSMRVNLTSAGFRSNSELGQVLDCATGRIITPTIKSEGDALIAIVRAKAALANLIVFHRKMPKPQ